MAQLALSRAIAADATDRRLLDELPARLAAGAAPLRRDRPSASGIGEADVLARLARLQPMRRGHAGSAPWSRRTPPAASTLAAMAVPDHALEEIAAFVGAYPEVNHNYEREHG